ncbi:chymotrypsin-like elastase family member 3B [Ochotona princeps]|uniref:chymotrypsin-like elastase family member 3B n=1 Tax=Ochotona princeps TaxID=9978 RepID=UPI002714AE15|nr:chymotrypsin-like elastase family member 3B [Ochotona princeps]
MIRLLSSLLLVALASGSDQPSYNPSSRVVNGEDAEPNSWPWQALLQYKASGGWSFTCGGTLIGCCWVMTAAHCVVSGGTYRVVLGEHDRSVTSGHEQTITVEKVFVHPQYDDNDVSKGYDIALLKLSECANKTDEVKPAPLPPPGYILPHGTECYVTGWGRLSTGGQLPSKLQQGLLPVVDYEHCSQRDWWGSTVKETMVCAGGYEVSSCNGDSGGPLNCPGVNCKWEVNGIVSFGSARGCNTEKKPSVFTRVSAYIDWIEEKPLVSARMWCFIEWIEKITGIDFS